MEPPHSIAIMFLGLRTVIYPVRDLETAKRWWSTVLGIDPYFDQPYYVAFNVNGYELALDPHGHAESGPGPVTYWGGTNLAHHAGHIRTAALWHQPCILEAPLSTGRPSRVRLRRSTLSFARTTAGEWHGGTAAPARPRSPRRQGRC
jgi:catechol 2,3-dioxygenase-like lactoylglutathione lyase family enzyme